MPAFIVTNWYHLEAGWEIALHRHEDFEVLYLASGEACLEVAHKEYRMEAGRLAFIGALEAHRGKALDGGGELYGFTLSPVRLDHRIGNPQLTSIFKNRPDRFYHCEEATPSTDGLVRKILDECELKDELSEDMIACYLHELLTEQYRRNRQMFPMPDSSMRLRVLQVKDYLDTNFAREIKVSELADIFYINKYYLSHIFRTLTGYSPKQYLQLNRLTHAKKLLTTTSLPIRQIAQNCGFPDSNSFIRAYKNEFHNTPHRSRKD